MDKKSNARARDDIDKLYKTKRWQKIRKMVIVRDLGICQECKKCGRYSRGNTVHHIIEAREDIEMFWDIDNLELICPSCHNKEHPDKAWGWRTKKKKKKGVVKFYSTREGG